MTTNFIEDSFSTTSTWPFMTKFWTSVISTLQHPPTRASADMLGLKTLVDDTRSSQRSKFAFRSLAFGCLLFARTTLLATFMTTAIQGSSASSHTLRLLFISLMAHSGRMGAPAATRDAYSHETGHATISMANLQTRVTTRKLLGTFLVAIRDWILACLPRGGGHVVQRGLSTGTMRYHIWGPRTMWRCELLRMAWLFAGVFSAIVFSLTFVPAVKGSSPLINIRKIITKTP